MTRNIALKLQYVLVPNARPFVDWRVSEDATGDFIDYWNPDLGAQPSDAAIDAITDQQIINARVTLFAQAAKTAAASSIDNGALISGDKHERIVRALVGLMLDEFNAHAVKINAILTASDAATSLADFQTRMRQIAAYPARTAEQLVTAIKTKLAETPE